MINDIFFELVRVSVGHLQTLSRIPTAEEWQKLFVLARKHSLEGVLYRSVEQLPLAQRPDAGFMLQWFGLVKRYERLNVAINQRAVEASAYFSHLGIRNCVLKGQGIATYYPEPLLRVPGDIDLWVDTDRECVYAMDICSDKWLQTTYLHLHSKVFKETALELHVKPSWMSSPFLNCRLQRYFKRCWEVDGQRTIALLGTEGDITVPSLEFNRFYLLLHIYHHLFGEGIGLRQLMDYYYVLLSESDEASLQRSRDLLKEYHLVKFAGAVMYVEQKVFGLPKEKLLVAVDEGEGEFLLKEVMTAGNFGKYDERINRKWYRSTPRRFVLSVVRNMKFLWRYPREVAWDPLFRSWFYMWRWFRALRERF